jgi:GABA permease
MIGNQHASSPGLSHGLKERHMTMIALGGVIGAGLFVGSGVVIKSAVSDRKQSAQFSPRYPL